MVRTLVITLTLLLISAARTFAGDAVLEKSDLFHRGDEGYAVYRIPGIVVTTKGSILAYCEARRKGTGDWEQIDIFVRRSTDGGKTWDVARKVAHLGDRVARNPVVL